VSLAKTRFLSGSLQRHGQGGADALLLHGMIAAVFLVFCFIGYLIFSCP
jgi:hypothetical protein